MRKDIEFISQNIISSQPNLVRFLARALMHQRLLFSCTIGSHLACLERLFLAKRPLIALFLVAIAPFDQKRGSTFVISQ